MTTRYRLAKNTRYTLTFGVPAAGTHELRQDNGGTITAISGWTQAKSGTTLTVTIPASSTSTPSNVVLVDTATNNVLHRASISWAPGPTASVPIPGSVTLESLAFDPQTQEEANAGTTALLKQHNEQAAAYTLALTDEGNVVEMNSATAVTVTVPTNATVAFPVGAVVTVRMLGAGAVTVAAAAGVTIRSAGGALRIATQYGEATLTKRAADEWVLAGNIVV